jgi:hypothetical protein
VPILIKEKYIMASLDLTNKIFGKLTALHTVPNKPGDRHIKWKCKCECGNFHHVTTNQLTSGRSTHCGCVKPESKRKIDITNRKFGKLTAIEPTYHNEKLKWKCICECGKECIVITDKLMSGHTKSCGCNKITVHYDNHYRRNASNGSGVLTELKSYFQQRYSDGNLTFEQFEELSKNNCHYCGAGPSNTIKLKYKDYTAFIKYNGLDRKDNNKKHDSDNVVTCCKNCNYSKRNSSYAEFSERIGKGL